MASRFEQVTDIDKMLALRSVGVLYWLSPGTGRMRMLSAKEITKDEQLLLCRSQLYYVLVEDDCEQPL